MSLKALIAPILLYKEIDFYVTNLFGH